MTKKSGKKSKAGWYVTFAIFGITVIGATREIALRQWVTIDLPNPPAPLAYVADAPVPPVQ